MFKSAILAAVAAFGFGAGVQAATVVSFEMNLRYDGTVYYETNINGWLQDSILADDFFLPLPTWNHQLSIGDITSFMAVISIPDDQGAALDYFDNGGRAISCSLGGVDCSRVTRVLNWANEYILESGEYDLISFVPEVGGKLQAIFNIGNYSDVAGVEFRDRAAKFTVVEVIQLAPVPLPASSALLPLGIGALAMMRKRRRRVS